MTAPRIDTFRREVRDAGDLLRFLAQNVDTLHDLAYSRHRNPTADRVRGGQRDYALDTHGDPKARELYADSAKTVLALVDRLVTVEAEVRSFLTAGTAGGSVDLNAGTSTDEVVRQIAARRRRVARGEYEPHPIAKQPVVVPSMDWQTECEVLRSAVRKVTTEFRQDHQLCQPPEAGLGRFKRKLLRRYPTKNLSTREREAWNRAQSVAGESAEKAS